MNQKTKIWVRSILGIAFMAALIFISSGHFDYWQGWIYFGLNLAFVAATAVSLRNDPGLVAERLHPGKGMKWWDKGYSLLSTPLYFAAVIIAGLDACRRHWGPYPPHRYRSTIRSPTTSMWHSSKSLGSIERVIKETSKMHLRA